MHIHFRLGNILYENTACKYDTNIQHDYAPLHRPLFVLTIA